uniref:Uncharacterized protein n=1 Tax=Rhizophora mucronata TaxID=61149 RepID=A0A2P2N8C9_RHIMU
MIIVMTIAINRGECYSYWLLPFQLLINPKPLATDQVQLAMTCRSRAIYPIQQYNFHHEKDACPNKCS